jgi:hypothetical protein
MMVPKQCTRCYSLGRRGVPAKWIDPEQEEICNSCRIELRWEETDCRPIGEAAPAPVKGQPWSVANAALYRKPSPKAQPPTPPESLDAAAPLRQPLDNCASPGCTTHVHNSKSGFCKLHQPKPGRKRKIWR